ncbi:hypothetical protein LCGC14_1486080 [marine sediment metagenome]|uniref:Uncharacterized protein n=1 Tax=marine sediment metagenome TaxID=412755 RepID=A0A0F9LNR3_9ZZZZ
MAKHLPTSIWPLRVGKPKTANAYVRTRDTEALIVDVVDRFSIGVAHFVLSRHDMRMLAKRINQCLDQTRS